MKVHSSLVASILFLLPLVAPTEALAQAILPVSRGGTGASSFTSGSIPFIFNGIFSQDNSNFFWDNTNKRLGIGTNSPSSALEVTSDAKINTLTVGLGSGSVSSNTAFGKDALLNATSSNYSLTAIGNHALANPVANRGESTAVGSFALWSGGGDQNTSIGAASMYNTTTGQYNTAAGYSALKENTSGSYNIGVGSDVLYHNTSGNLNIALGWRSAFYQADGSSSLTSPNYSIYIGGLARGYDNNDFNSIVIGTNAIGAGANKTVIGNSDMTDIYFGSSSANANTHAKRMYLGSSSVPGCIVMGDTAGGVGYITLDSGVLAVSSTPPTACQ